MMKITVAFIAFIAFTLLTPPHLHTRHTRHTLTANVFLPSFLPSSLSPKVQKAFEILNADENVHAILVNIFGGIMRCDVIAQGMINAAAAIGLKKPVICRLQVMKTTYYHP